MTLVSFTEEIPRMSGGFLAGDVDTTLVVVCVIVQKRQCQWIAPSVNEPFCGFKSVAYTTLNKLLSESCSSCCIFIHLWTDDMLLYFVRVVQDFKIIVYTQKKSVLLCAGMTSAGGRSSLIKPASATLLTLTVMLLARLSASQGSRTYVCHQSSVQYHVCHSHRWPAAEIMPFILLR